MKSNQMVLLLVVAMIAIIVIVIILFVVILPMMRVANQVLDEDYRSDSEALLVGKLSLGIDTIDSIGEVVVPGANDSLVNKPAKIYQQINQPISSISEGSNVLVIKVKEGVAYVIPYHKI